MKPSLIVEIINNNTKEFEQLYNHLLDLEASCDMLMDSKPESIEYFHKMIAATLIKYKNSKLVLLSDAFCSIKEN